MDGLKWTPAWVLVVAVVNAGTAACSDDGGSGGSAGSSSTAGTTSGAGANGVAGSPAGGSPAGGTTGNAGTSTSAGTGAGVAGSSAGGAGTGPRAAVSLNVATGPGCKLPAGTVDMPVVAGGHPISAAGATKPIADNTVTPEGLVRVTCEMRGGLAHGEIRNEMTGQSAEVSSGYPTATPQLSGLLARIVATETTYTGNEGNPCALTLLESTSTSFLVKATCPTFLPVDGSEGSCVLNESYAYFEGCAN